VYPSSRNKLIYTKSAVCHNKSMKPGSQY